MSIIESFRLDGQAALVTGASRGLGQAMAIALAEAGADVAVVAHNPCAETVAAIEAVGRRAIAPVPGDPRPHGSCQVK